MTEPEWYERDAGSSQPSIVDKESLYREMAMALLFDKDITPDMRWWAQTVLATAGFDEKIPAWIRMIAGTKLEYSKRTAILAGEEFCQMWLEENQRKADSDEHKGERPPD